jgi:drug/metabolite transporter (DMT)-like permease
MKYLIVLLLCTLAISKVTAQGAFAKKNVKDLSGSLLFNGLIFSTVAILFSWQVVNASVPVWIYGVLFGAFSAGFQICYTRALALGNVSITVLVVNLSMIFPIMVSFLVFNESMSVMRIIGIVLTIASFFVVTDFGERKKLNFKWLLLAFAAMLFNCALTITQKVFGKSEFTSQNEKFIACGYISAAVISLLIYLIIRRKTDLLSIPKKPSILLYAAMAGTFLATFQFFYTNAISTIDGTFLFPAYSGGCIVLSTVFSLVFFKERLDKKQILGLIIGTAALVLMNF